ncbi:MAG TPA: NIL domain-containing protein [Acidimicrobiia bacterium]|nr:NIL domain-containing protein [Acidimicrobiia bacterium]
MSGTDADALKLFVSFPEELVERPIVYDIVKQFDVIPNIRRAGVEAHSGWIIFELSGPADKRDAAVAYLESLGCIVDRMEGDVVAG